MGPLNAPRITGLRLDRTAVVGIVNVTPDSFSDGGSFADADAAIRHGSGLIAAGADLVDVGGESTRPGALRISPIQERSRVLPVVRGLGAAGCLTSVDTMYAETARAAVQAGAVMINDVSGGLADPAMLDTVAELGIPIVLMHWRAHSERMDEFADYRDVVAQVRDELALRRDAALAAGIHRCDIVLDPGLGFAKQHHHNWALLANLDVLAQLGQPLMIGAARKRFLGQLLADETGARHVAQRDDATAAVSALAAAAGVWAVRVHDVRGSADAVRVASAWQTAGARGGAAGDWWGAALVGSGESRATDRIAITGIRATGFHGVLAHERVQGQEFVVDVVIHTDTETAARIDELAATIDYAQVANLVNERIAGRPFQLIESLAEAIATDILALDGILGVDVCVHKPDAPIAVAVEDVAVRIRRQR